MILFGHGADFPALDIDPISSGDSRPQMGGPIMPVKLSFPDRRQFLAASAIAAAYGLMGLGNRPFNRGVTHEHH
jgi:hypothetical protein